MIMRKSTLFISAILTTFMLAVLFGVVSAYQSSLGSTQEAAVPPPTAAMVQVVNTTAPVQVTLITPEEAAAIASKVLNRTDLYSVEAAQLEGVDTYLVTFSSGDTVHISMDGQVLSISKLAVTVITQPGNTGGGNGNDNGNNSNDGEHEDHEDDDHEENEHEEDDD
jgi:hypothetical protein